MNRVLSLRCVSVTLPQTTVNKMPAGANAGWAWLVQRRDVECWPRCHGNKWQSYPILTFFNFYGPPSNLKGINKTEVVNCEKINVSLLQNHFRSSFANKLIFKKLNFRNRTVSFLEKCFPLHSDCFERHLQSIATLILTFADLNHGTERICSVLLVPFGAFLMQPSGT